MDLAPGLRRLLAPRAIAVAGGRHAETVIRECRRIGFAGAVWPVHPTRREIGGLPCFASVADLPGAPDAAFLAVPAAACVDLAAQFASKGAGALVCYSAGFAEAGPAGRQLQQRLVAAAGTMPIVGPNCYGVLNLLEGCVLWPDVHGAKRVERGVALLTQSGNIALNVTMQRRGLPVAMVIAMGNKAVGDHGDYIQALLEDERVTAIGVHCEGLDDVAGFSRAAARALGQNVPICVLKTGRSALGAHAALSHTASLAGPDRLYAALFQRHGVACARDLDDFVETLKFLHLFGGLPGRRIVSMSCSGGEAALVADLAEDARLELPAFPPECGAALAGLLGEKVQVGNPLDYHTYIWGDRAQSEAVFTQAMRSRADLHLLLLDMPREDRGLAPDTGFFVARDAFAAAQAATGARAALVATLPENMREEDAGQMIQSGIAPMQGLSACLAAIRRAADFGAARRRTPAAALRGGGGRFDGGEFKLATERQAKVLLASCGVSVPEGMECGAADAAQAAAGLGFPVALKLSSAAVAHKTEIGGVALNLADGGAVARAAAAMAHLGGRFLVERMAEKPLAELLVGVTRDAQFGLAVTLAAGGVLAELLADSVTLLPPCSDAELDGALASLRVARLLDGFRGGSKADLDAVRAAIRGILACAEALGEKFGEIEINPLFVYARGAVAVDALLRLKE